MDKSYLECPEGCKACNSATLCTACNSGYILENDLCEECPDGKYWTEPGTCLGSFLYIIV